jgi:hypothetical protein
MSDILSNRDTVSQATNRSMKESNTTVRPEELDTEETRAHTGGLAYEILLLQQRLAAYEQLHIEEMAELRQEIERIRRAFLLETSPRMRAIAPMQHGRMQE